MSRNMRYRMWASRVVVLLAPLSFAAATSGQESSKTVVGQGEVTGSDVYVRSGPSLNHYTVCKLGAGDRVTVVGDSAGWYEILPPPGTHSLISGDFVDTSDDKIGVVNGDNVRVRAGSSLNDSKYTVQTHLSKGAEVTILGRDPDGFLRIAPPNGTSVWISRQFVGMVPASRLALESTTSQPTVARKTTTAAPGVTRNQSTTGEPVSGTAFARITDAGLRTTLERLDARARGEVTKPVTQRRFRPLIDQYKPIAVQTGDEFASRYAKARIDQLSGMADLVETVTNLRKLNDAAATSRRGFLQGRAEIREKLPPIPTGIDVQGELRLSALYPPGSFPQRYRLVDPNSPVARTLGYVEIPADSSLKVEDFLGRHVGVRASATRLHTGGVDPVPIYVASELIALSSPQKTLEAAEPEQDWSSPAPFTNQPKRRGRNRSAQMSARQANRPKSPMPKRALP